MKDIYIDELKKIQINITKEVHKFCVENGLRYSLTYGSLIGAVRHNGYIPWDDDIDLLMPRPDFELFKKNFKHSYLVFADRDTDSSCNVTYGKVFDNRTLIDEYTSVKWKSGVYIDIFPIDGLGRDYQLAVNHYKKLSYLRILRDFKIVKLSRARSLFRNAILLLGKIILLPFTFRFLQDKTIKLLKKYKFEESSYAAELSFGTYKRILPRELFEDFILHKFEGEYFYILKNFDTYLNNVFGDYMQLPPEEKRVTHHSFKAYWI